jgi:hypothetical protein
MSFKYKKIIYLILLFSFFIFNFSFTLAAESTSVFDSDYGLADASDAAGFNSGAAEIDLFIIIGRITGVFVSFVGFVFFLLLIYGGFTWMTSLGNETKVEKAKKIIVSSIWGLIIVFMAYIISILIVNAFSAVVPAQPAP